MKVNSLPSLDLRIKKKDEIVSANLYGNYGKISHKFPRKLSTWEWNLWNRNKWNPRSRILPARQRLIKFHSSVDLAYRFVRKRMLI
jgi:hypothetical protein